MQVNDFNLKASIHFFFFSVQEPKEMFQIFLTQRGGNSWRAAHRLVSILVLDETVDIVCNGAELSSNFRDAGAN
jgi:hypothetical protein